MDIRLFVNGCIIQRIGRANGTCGKSSTVRGRVSSFSLASRRRLREFLLRKIVPSSRLFGVTLTIPFNSDCDCCTLFRSVWHRFRMSLVRRFPDAGFVWRVELQRNKMPHLHIVSYHTCDVSSSDYLGLWYSSVSQSFDIPSLSAFARHGVLVQPLDGSINAYRYICDHGSKAKQAQLGWQGRQWGVIGKSFFVDRISQSFNVPDFLEHKFNRFLSRVCAFRVRSDCPFGNKLVHSRRKFRVCYVSESAVRRWLKFNGVQVNTFQ